MLIPSAATSSDASGRFVATAGSPFVCNLAALWATQPALALELEAVPEADALTTEPSRAGQPTLAAPDAAGQRIYLHSRYRPLEEAQQLVAAHATAGRVAFVCFGLGLGHHLRVLFDEVSKESLIWVFEPDARVVRAWLESADWRDLLNSRRVTVMTRLDKARCFDLWLANNTALSLGFAPLEHPPSVRRNPEYFEAARALVADYLSFGQTTMNTLLINGRRTAENLARNAAWYAAAPGIGRLKDAYRGRTAIIVSAGPSLRKNQHLLAAARERAVIIAVQTTLQPLLEMGIEPDFVTSLDYHDICTRFFEKVPPGCRTELVAEAKASPAVLKMHPGPKSLLGNSFIEKLLAEAAPARPTLRPGATVAHLAFYLAEYLRCDPILFVGQDLGFSDGLCYTPGTGYDDVWAPELSRFCTTEMKQWEQIARDRPILRRVPDYLGRPMYTEERLFTYLQQFEREFQLSRRTIIDATEGGVLKRGATPMPLADALATYATAPLDRNLPAHAGLDYDRLPLAGECLRRRGDEARKIADISQAVLPLLQEIVGCLHDQPRVNGLIARIDRLRAGVIDLGHCFDLITQVTQQTEMKRYEADRRIGAAGDDAALRQRLQVERDIDNVKNIIDAAGVFAELMDDAAARVAEFAEGDPRLTGEAGAVSRSWASGVSGATGGPAAHEVSPARDDLLARGDLVVSEDSHASGTTDAIENPRDSNEPGERRAGAKAVA